MAVQMHQGNLPHIWWIDLKQNGTFVECAVMKRDAFGNVSFFPLTSLDNIDKRRLHKIVSNRNATNFELWDLMSNITLNNGVNALEYFHQLVKVITPAGQVHKPQQGVVGIGQSGVIDTTTEDARQQKEMETAAVAKAAADAAAQAAVAAMSAPAQAPAQQVLTEEQVEAPAVKKAAPKKAATKKATTKRATKKAS